MKEYVRKSENSSVVLNDPLKGYVKKVFEDQKRLEAIKQGQEAKLGGYGTNGDVLLAERFNPNNAELNK